MIKMVGKIIMFLLFALCIGLPLTVYYLRQQLVTDSAAQTIIIKNHFRDTER